MEFKNHKRVGENNMKILKQIWNINAVLILIILLFISFKTIFDYIKEKTAKKSDYQRSVDVISDPVEIDETEKKALGEVITLNDYLIFEVQSNLVLQKEITDHEEEIVFHSYLAGNNDILLFAEKNGDTMEYKTYNCSTGIIEELFDFHENSVKKKFNSDSGLDLDLDCLLD